MENPSQSPGTPHQQGLFDDAGGPGLRDADVEIHRTAIDGPAADRFFDHLVEATPWTQEETVMFGKKHQIPRLTSWHGDPLHTYSYSGIHNEPEPWTPALIEIRDLTQDLADTTFNSVLLNLYRDGNDGVSWHADDEPELSDQPVIGSVSLGASRRFQFRRRDGGSIESIDLHHGDILVMSGPTQRFWLHQIPKTAKEVGPRINLTFRKIEATTTN
jgi:alkylated DNA repair dioxygenase AlkB